jgi:hypothetical protein
MVQGGAQWYQNPGSPKVTNGTRTKVVDCGSAWHATKRWFSEVEAGKNGTETSSGS